LKFDIGRTRWPVGFKTPVNRKFIHEIELRAPIEELTTQCWFTIQRRERDPSLQP
jgi:hypothetical protein